MIDKLMRYLRKRKEVRHLCERVRYGFMNKECKTEGVMGHLVDGKYYLITVELKSLNDT